MSDLKDQKIAQAFKEYKEKIAHGLKEYREKRAQAFKEYKEKRAQAVKEFDEEQALKSIPSSLGQSSSLLSERERERD